MVQLFSLPSPLARGFQFLFPVAEISPDRVTSSIGKTSSIQYHLVMSISLKPPHQCSRLYPTQNQGVFLTLGVQELRVDFSEPKARGLQVKGGIAYDNNNYLRESSGYWMLLSKGRVGLDFV